MAEAGVAAEVAEACLAHMPKGKVVQAYQRSDLLERRAEGPPGVGQTTLRMAISAIRKAGSLGCLHALWVRNPRRATLSLHERSGIVGSASPTLDIRLGS